MTVLEHGWTCQKLASLGAQDFGRIRHPKFPCQIVSVTEENLKVDFNHPLAGKDLVFDLELIEVDAK